MSASATRITALAGLASFTLIIAAALVSPPLWDSPETTASSSEVLTYLEDHQGRSIAGLFIYSLGMGFFLCFVAGLYVWLREQERGLAPLSAVFAFGGVALTALILISFAPIGVALYRADHPDFESELAGMLTDLTFYGLALSGIPTAVCLGAYAAIVLRGAPLPRWTAWLAILGTVAHLLIAATLFWRSGFFSLEGDVIVFVPATYFGWILAAGVSLLRVRPAV